MVASEEKPQPEQPMLIAEKDTKEDAPEDPTRDEERSAFENGNGNGHTSKTSEHNGHQSAGSLRATARGNEMPSKSRFLFLVDSLLYYNIITKKIRIAP